MAKRKDRDRSTRVTLAYDEAGFRVVQMSPRPKGPGPTVLSVDAPSPHDVWVEGRDPTDRIRYRLRLPRAFAGGNEVFSPDGSIRTAGGLRSRGVVTFVVPYDPSVVSLSVHAGPLAVAPPGRGTSSEESRELFAFPLAHSPAPGQDIGGRP
jgi:hypothetical protein